MLPGFFLPVTAGSCHGNPSSVSDAAVLRKSHSVHLKNF